mmetsp:Transcript_40388/g.95995  ORF Transcript_40388/g.95995 Transcript_40388/m.95995 type:complete len:238 (+) Transcript_40388:1205-1918(+)
MHVVVQNRRHLQLLNRGDAALRKEDEALHVLLPAQACYCRAAGVTRGGADDCDSLVVAEQEILEKVAQSLQRDILERERRAVEQLHDLKITHRAHRHHILVRKALVALLHQRLQVLLRDLIPDELRRDRVRKLVERLVLPATPLLGDVRDEMRHQESPIRRQPLKDSLLEGHVQKVSSCAAEQHLSRSSVRNVRGGVQARVVEQSQSSGKTSGVEQGRGHRDENGKAADCNRSCEGE